MEQFLGKMMRCFFIFKDKRKSGGKSAPELGSSDNSGATSSNRVAKSTGSLSSHVARSIPEMYREREGSMRVFSLTELREATNNFNRLLKIGEGGFGSVYKGSINPADGGGGPPTIVAIKKLNTQGLQVILVVH